MQEICSSGSVGFLLPTSATTDCQVPALGQIGQALPASPESNGAWHPVTFAREEPAESGNPDDNLTHGWRSFWWMLGLVPFHEQDFPFFVCHEFRAGRVGIGSDHQSNHEQSHI